MLKFAASVSLSALALAACAANPQLAAVPASADQPGPIAAADPALTPERAREFVARAEKELGEFTVINARAQWVNATYITEDTDALATHFGTIGT